MSFCNIKFNPPVCMQRYEAMRNMVKKYQPRKVLDMGCGECSLLRQLKREPGIQQLTGVDLDRDVLQANRHFAKPLMYEYLHPRPEAFTVSLYEGSVGDKDSRMLGYDLMLCVELIEHLYPDTLAALPEAVFGYMQPRIAVFTTPNADFNVLFPNFQGFRHPDHKFEWSREEFQSWANQVASEYGYTVTYEGIGAGPPGTEHLGCCTQMAIFTCVSPPCEGRRDVNNDTPYKLVCEVKHPHCEITTTTDEQILSECAYYLRQMSRDTKWQCTEEEDITGSHGEEGRTDVNEEKERTELSVPLETMMKYSCLRKVCPSVDKLREVLTSWDYVSMSEDGASVIYPIAKPTSDSSDESDNSKTEADIDADLDSSENDLSLWQHQEESWD